MYTYYSVELAATRWIAVVHHVKIVVLFFPAPFVGLPYLPALPEVDVGAFVHFVTKAARR